ncbi:MAG: flagellar filament capping protein FliD [Syntrophotaleaceae bacterium]
MAISFGGLATGLDTTSLIKQLMEAERRPLSRLETDKAFFSARLSALAKFEDKLDGFLSKIEDLDSVTELQAKKATLSSEDFFAATADSDALPGSYQVEVVDLAQVQKSVSQGVSSKTANSFGTGSLTLTVGSEAPVSITIDAESNSLEGIMTAINEADAGVTAAIINDGTASPYRLVVTGNDIATGFSLDFSALAGGVEGYEPPALATTQNAQQAHIRVDGIDIYSDSNTLSEAIPGVSLDLSKAEEGTLTNLTVKLDEDSIKGLIKDFVSGYNDVVSFVTSQSKSEGGSAGILVGDSGLNNIKRRLQSLLTTQAGGSITSLSQLGLETQKDGTLQIDDATLSDAIKSNLSGVTELLVGNESVDGIATRFKNYLEDITDNTDGFYAGRKESIERNVKRIEKGIERMEMRLEKREQNLYDQFNALEQLISGMNSTSSYLSAQLESLENLWSYKR